MLDRLIHEPVRLRIMAALHRNRQASFASLRDGLTLTDGNLQSHAQRLVDAGYVEAARAFSGSRFELQYRITRPGVEAFLAYLEALDAIVKPDAIHPRGDRFD